MPNDSIYNDPRFAEFYDLHNPWSEDRTFSLNLARGCSSVLDLGCGTGSLAIEIAKAGVPSVVGVDPSRAMLNIAQQRDDEGLVQWVEQDARTLMVNKRFELIVMTGHAFQCFLTRSDQRAALKAIALHLAKGGRFVFDTRNPTFEEWKGWVPEETTNSFIHPTHGRIVGWNDAVYDASSQIVTYATHYRVESEGQTLSAIDKIAFPTRQQLENLFDDEGFVVDRWMGDWDGQDWTDKSLEIIPIGRKL